MASITMPAMAFLCAITGPLYAQKVGNNTADPTHKVNQLTAVTITGKKQLYEQKIDRLIINVAANITASGSTVLDILERSPGIITDRQNGSISMNGKSGVVVMINGKINHMPMSALVQLLAGMNAGNIEKIELITTPPASFDAAGNAGYINIVLKENNEEGTNGSLALTAGYSKGEIIAGNININHRKGKINLYGDLSYARNRSPFTVDDVSKFMVQADQIESHMDLDRVQTIGHGNGRVGMDLQLSKHTILGVLLSGYDSYLSHHEDVYMQKYKNGITDTIMRLVNKEVNHWRNFSGNINLQHSYNKDGNVSLNLDYSGYKNNEPVNYQSRFYNANDSFLYENQYRSSKTTPLHFLVAALDGNNRLTEHTSMEYGLKTTFSTFDNNIVFERWIQQHYERDSVLSANYRLKENYSAAYLSFRIAPGKSTDIKMGLRYEYTNSNLSAAAATIIDRHYGNLFPDFFLTHRFNGKNVINMAYSRRISRPSFNDLAPYFYYGNPNTILTGNPSLQPSFSNTLQVSYSFRKYLFTASWSKEKNAIAAFQPRADAASGSLILAPENLDNQKIFTATLSIPLNITGWWNMQYNLTGNWQQVNAVYKTQPVRIQQINGQVNGTMNFKLPRSVDIEVTGYYRSKNLSGLTTLLPVGSADIGIKKKLPARQGAFTFTATNIFNTLVSRNRTDIQEKSLFYDFDVHYAWRGFRLTYTRSFGKEKLKQKRERPTGIEEEKNRVQ